MPPTLTLHHGDAEAEYAEHPTITARRALEAAATVEDAEWAPLMRRFARLLPRRAPLPKDGE